MPEVPATCGCGAAWTGRGRAHCAACHATFSGVSGFDAHRTGGTGCRAPAEVGFRLDGGVWRWPGADYRW